MPSTTNKQSAITEKENQQEEIQLEEIAVTSPDSVDSPESLESIIENMPEGSLDSPENKEFWTPTRKNAIKGLILVSIPSLLAYSFLTESAEFALENLIVEEGILQNAKTFFTKVGEFGIVKSLLSLASEFMGLKIFKKFWNGTVELKKNESRQKNKTFNQIESEMEKLEKQVTFLKDCLVKNEIVTEKEISESGIF